METIWVVVNALWVAAIGLLLVGIGYTLRDLFREWKR